jgi:hypothetical protein
MQYTKLGFRRLFKGCNSHQVPCSLIVNRSVTPTLHIANVIAQCKKPTAQTAHLVFSDTQANAQKNQKSCFLPTLDRNRK